MPKRYKIDMTLTEEASNTQLAADSEVVTYRDDAEAKKKFDEKKEASRKAGKASG